MKKGWKAVAAFGLTAAIALGSILPGNTLQVKAASDSGVEAFVSRMYTVALGREAEEAGLKDWSSQLENKTNDGAGLAHGFIMSDEFRKKGLDDKEYLDILYATFFDREPDEGGYNDWMGKLKSGTARSAVLAGFTNSEEFSNLCEKFGILRGYMYSDGSAANAGIGQFVSRLYSKALGRTGESAGINDWTTQIATRATTAEQTATNGFFNSAEFQQKDLTNSEFLDILYATFFDRVADEGGKTEWQNKMQAGTSRGDVILGFSRSEEFNNLLAKYGLTGEIHLPTADETPNPDTCIHHFEKYYWPAEPTCTHGGYYNLHCTICGANGGDGTDPALPHTPVTVIEGNMPTYCDEYVPIKTYCSVCGDILENKASHNGDAYYGTEHEWVTRTYKDYQDWDEETHTFVTKEWTYCKRCDIPYDTWCEKSEDQKSENQGTEHEWVTEAGVTSCKRCGVSYEQNSCNHEWITGTYKVEGKRVFDEETQTYVFKDVYREWTYCSHCNIVYNRWCKIYR